MSDDFDPYYEWLGIQPKDQPPHHYRLLGIEPFEENLSVIERAADRQMSHVRTFQTGRHAQQSQKLLNELSAAKLCLLQTGRKQAYDAQLRRRVSRTPDVPPAESLPPAALPDEISRRPRVSARLPGDDTGAQPQAPAGSSIGPSFPLNGLTPEDTPARLHRRRQRTWWQQPAVLVGVLGFLVVMVVALLLAGGLPWRSVVAPLPASPSTRGGVTSEPKAPEEPVTDEPPIEFVEADAAIDEVEKPPGRQALEQPWSPAPQLEHEVERSLGILTSEYGFCQMMLWREFVDLVPVMRRHAYRPIRIRPYADHQMLRVAVLWTRDDRPFRLVGGVSAQRLQAAHESMTTQNFRPVDVAAWQDGDKARFLAVWVEPDPSEAARRLTIATAKTDTGNLTDRMQGDGFRPETRQAFLGADGQPCYSQVWVHVEDARWHQWEVSGTAHTKTLRELNVAPSDVSLFPDAEGRLVYSGCALPLAGMEFIELFDLAPESLCEQVKSYADRGFQPTALAVVHDPQRDRLTTASIWQARSPDSPGATGSDDAASAPTANGGARPAVAEGGASSHIDHRQDLAPERAPRPDPAGQRAAVQEIRARHERQFAEAKTDPNRLSLAADLLYELGEEPDPQLQYGLLTAARELAVAAAEPHLALRTIDEMADRFYVDAWTMKAETLQEMSGEIRSAVDRRNVAEAALELAAKACIDEAFEAAGRLLAVASSDVQTRRLAATRQRELNHARRTRQAAQQARLRLVEAPDDPAAHWALGRYLCFQRNQWGEGLVHLAESEDATLSEIARRDLAGPSEAVDQFLLAERWYSWAETAPADRNGGWMRAQYWYGEAVSRLEGAQQKQAESKLQELAESVTTRGEIGSASLAFLDAEPGHVLRLHGHSGPVTQLAVPKAGKWVVSGSADDTVRVWDLVGGKERLSIPVSVKRIQGLALTTGDQFVIVGGDSTTLEVWRLATGTPMPPGIQVDGPTLGLAIAGDGRRLWWARRGDPPGNLRLMDLKTGTTLFQFDVPTTPRNLAYDPSGLLLAVSDQRNHVYISSLFGDHGATHFSGPAEPIVAMALSPNQRYLAGCTNGDAVIWDAATGRELRRLQADNETFTCLAFARDSRRLLTGGRGARISLWDVKLGTLVGRLEAPAADARATRSIALLPDTRGAVSGDSNGSVHVWRLPD